MIALPLFIGGPFTGNNTKDEHYLNTAKVAILAAFYRTQGYTPYLPHAIGMYGVFEERDPVDTHRSAMKCTLGMLEFIGNYTKTRLTAVFLLPDEGIPRGGTAEEIQKCRIMGFPFKAATWKNWIRTIFKNIREPYTFLSRVIEMAALPDHIEGKLWKSINKVISEYSSELDNQTKPSAEARR